MPDLGRRVGGDGGGFRRWYDINNPRYGYLIAGGILLLWLVGVICGWKWTYEPNRWGWHWLRDTFGEGAVRFCVGALLVVALAGVTCLYFATG